MVFNTEHIYVFGFLFFSFSFSFLFFGKNCRGIFNTFNCIGYLWTVLSNKWKECLLEFQVFGFMLVSCHLIFSSVYITILIIPQNFYYPEHVGLKIGTNNTPRYVVMETHYDNPDRRNGTWRIYKEYFTRTYKTTPYHIRIVNGYFRPVPRLCWQLWSSLVVHQWNPDVRCRNLICWMGRYLSNGDTSETSWVGNSRLLSCSVH